MFFVIVLNNLKEYIFQENILQNIQSMLDIVSFEWPMNFHSPVIKQKLPFDREDLKHLKNVLSRNIF